MQASAFMLAEIRAAGADDEAVVMSAWLRGHRDRGDWPQRISKNRYFDEHKLTVTKLLARSTTLVACNPERPSQVLGFICFARGVLHWIYVKDTFRRMGVAGQLAAAAGLGNPNDETLCSHWTRPAREWLCSWDLRYDPFLLEEIT